MAALIQLLLIAAGITAFILVLIFVMVPLFKGIGWLIGGFFKGIGWLVTHIFEFIAGMLGDSVRFVGAIIAIVLLTPMALLSVIIGRWSAAGHFAESVKREFKVAGACLYRVALARPLKLVLLHGLLEGVEQRVPEAMAAAPTSDKPSRRTGQFPGYMILGSLKGGGSGAKLYIARPDEAVLAKYPDMPDRVVIKAFALTEGSSLPQIVRESRALECAKQLGLVFEHGMDEHRFYYVMPYHAGDHLGIITRQLHGETDGGGLTGRQLAVALNYICNLVETLCGYHDGGLWHKDVKPENIIIHDGEAHLVDLGLVTPLRSAMTLTTHGTEYFRDPEMVRLALRGVKVHQVNGAKFDIFAAGAVLYFMIENEFPPHGALSRFVKKSPEAIKWIVRRAMADYNHRYASTDEMLADLRHVASAADAFSVRPIDLPSMRGREDEALVLEDDEQEVASAVRAASPVPPPVPAPVVAGSHRRPRLRVTNWWTGEYRVDEPGPPGGGPAAESFSEYQQRMVRHHATAMRHQASEVRHKVRHGKMSERRAAREQVRAARGRAREIRRRATSKHHRHHHRAVAERQPSGMLMAIGLLTVCLIAVLIFALVIPRAASVTSTSLPGSISTIVIGEVQDAIEQARGGPSILIVSSVRDLTNPKIAERIEKIAEQYRGMDYNVIINHALVKNGVGELVAKWVETDGDPSVDDALEDILEELGLYGVLSITEEGKPGSSRWHLDENLIHSARPGAAERRALVPGPAHAQPYLLVNDHPTKYAPEVAGRVEAFVKQYEAAGWRITVDDDLEVLVRTALPAGRIEAGVVMPEMFHVVLRENDLAGILYVHAKPGDGPAEERFSVMRIDATQASED